VCVWVEHQIRACRVNLQCVYGYEITYVPAESICSVCMGLTTAVRRRGEERCLKEKEEDTKNPKVGLYNDETTNVWISQTLLKKERVVGSLRKRSLK